ncbi:hypothetical protein SeMB42_g06261 [Synchytrium endobioticum]|nr:hypothetical protein SeMB42_g06261 [Synchytrium endobioticum]
MTDRSLDAVVLELDPDVDAGTTATLLPSCSSPATSPNGGPSTRGGPSAPQHSSLPPSSPARKSPQTTSPSGADGIQCQAGNGSGGASPVRTTDRGSGAYSSPQPSTPTASDISNHQHSSNPNCHTCIASSSSTSASTLRMWMQETFAAEKWDAEYPANEHSTLAETPDHHYKQATIPQNIDQPPTPPNTPELPLTPRGLKFEAEEEKGSDEESSTGYEKSLSDQKGLTLSWRNLSFVVDTDKGYKQVLHNLNGQAKPGELLAIMGGSGAGKSSLMDVLSGRARGGRATGDVRFNNRSTDARWRARMAYVQQEDIFYETLTVRETLSYAAMLKLPYSMPHEEKLKRIDKVASETRLRDCLNTRVGDAVHRGISGGEKKRLHIATELLTDPGVLLLDEPTSGLDAFNAHNVIDAIRTSALENHRTVIISIHQPRKEILDLFDKILILATGKVLFYGNLDTALLYFTHVGFPVPRFMNPSDHFLDVSTMDTSTPRNRELSDAKIGSLTSIWKSQFDAIAFPSYNAPPDRVPHKKPFCLSGFSSTNNTLVAAPPSDADFATEVAKRQVGVTSIMADASGWMRRWSILVKRQCVVYFRDWTLVVMSPIANGLSILLFYQLWQFLPLTQNAAQSRLGLMFFLSLDRYMMWVNGVAIGLPLRLALFTRERTSGMYTGYQLFWAYYVAAFLCYFYQFVTVGPILYYLTGCQRVWSKFWTWFGIYCLVCLTGHAHGFFFGAQSRNMAFVLTFATLHLGIYCAFSGYIVEPSSIPKPLIWIAYMSPPFWTYSAWTQTELSGLVLTCPPHETRCLLTGEALLDILSLRDRSIGVCIAALAGICLVVTLIASKIFDTTTKPPWANAAVIVSEENVKNGYSKEVKG